MYLTWDALRMYLAWEANACSWMKNRGPHKYFRQNLQAELYSQALQFQRGKCNILFVDISVIGSKLTTIDRKIDLDRIPAELHNRVLIQFYCDHVRNGAVSSAILHMNWMHYLNISSLTVYEQRITVFGCRYACECLVPVETSNSVVRRDHIGTSALPLH